MYGARGCGARQRLFTIIIIMEETNKCILCMLEIKKGAIPLSIVKKPTFKCHHSLYIKVQAIIP
jgi:hypothetical protein